jgi:hypothetical protein
MVVMEHMLQLHAQVSAIAELTSNTEAQYSAAQDTIRALESKVLDLERMVNPPVIVATAAVPPPSTNNKDREEEIVNQVLRTHSNPLQSHPGRQRNPLKVCIFSVSGYFPDNYPNAEQAVNKRLAKTPELYLLALAQFAIAAEMDIMRSFSLVLLRRLLFRVSPSSSTQRLSHD